MSESAVQPSPSRVSTLVACCLVALIVLATYFAIAPTLASVAHQPGADEGFYQRYVTRVGSEGLGAFPAMTREWLADPRASIYPPPSRVGFILVATLWSKIAGTELTDLARLSLVCLLALVVVQFVFARRHFGDAPAVLIAALSVCSPLLLGMSRLALTENFITLCQVAALWLFVEVVRTPRAWSWRIAFVIAFTFAILSKEIAVLLAVPLAVFAALERFVRKRDVPLVALAAILAAPPLIALATWAVTSGGVTPLRQLLEIVLGSPASNAYAVKYGGGPWMRYPIDELLLSPVTTMLGLFGAVIALWRWRKGEYEPVLVSFALTYALLVAILSFFTKNVRYVAVLEAPLRVFAVVLVVRAFELRRVLVGRVLAAAFVLLMCWNDIANFRRAFVEFHIFDPMSQPLLEMRRMLPPSQQR